MAKFQLEKTELPGPAKPERKSEIEESHDFGSLRKVREQDRVERFVVHESTDINGLRDGISRVLIFPKPLQILWPLDTLVPIKLRDFWFDNLKFKKIYSKPMYLSGRRTLNSVPLGFMIRTPPTIDEHREAVQIASTLLWTRYSRAVHAKSTDRTTMHGMNFQETQKTQKRFKPLVPMEGPAAENIIRGYDGTSRAVLEAYIGTGMVPRLYCDHVYGPLAESCRMCSILFITEWISFARHILTTQLLLIGQQVYALQNHQINQGHLNYINRAIADVDWILIYGITITVNRTLRKIVQQFVKDLDIDGYMASQVGEDDGPAGDVESFFQILEFLMDVSGNWTAPA